VILEMKKKKKTKDYDILPEDYEEDYIVWFDKYEKLFE
jgi:hypothetical protein